MIALGLFISFVCLLAAGSVAHGCNALTRWAIPVAQAGIFAALYWGAWLPVAAAAVMFFVWMRYLRNGEQAQAELGVIVSRQYGEPPHLREWRFIAVEHAYPVGLGVPVERIVRWVDSHVWHVLYERRQQEGLIALLVTGPVCAALPSLLSLLNLFG